MKRIIAIALAVLCLSGCAKNKMLDLSGNWETSTRDGNLYLHLGSSGGTANFEGYETSNISYKAKDDWQAKFSGHIYTEDFRMYTLGEAYITKNGILKIETEILQDKKTTTLSFHKQ